MIGQGPYRHHAVVLTRSWQRTPLPLLRTNEHQCQGCSQQGPEHDDTRIWSKRECALVAGRYPWTDKSYLEVDALGCDAQGQRRVFLVMTPQGYAGGTRVRTAASDRGRGRDAVADPGVGARSEST
jgi:ribosomal protein L37AE/L43A